MSAWIVDKVHVDCMVAAALQYGGRDRLQWWKTDESGAYAGWWALDTCERASSGYREWLTPDGLGQVLVFENVASVSYRYSEAPAAGELPGPVETYYLEPYAYASPRYRFSPGDVSSLLSCYEYQACEHPDWYRSDVWQFCRSLERAALRSLCDGGEPWGWDTRGLTERKAKHPGRVDNAVSILDMRGAS